MVRRGGTRRGEGLGRGRGRERKKREREEGVGEGRRRGKGRGQIGREKREKERRVADKQRERVGGACRRRSRCDASRAAMRSHQPRSARGPLPRAPPAGAAVVRFSPQSQSSGCCPDSAVVEHQFRRTTRQPPPLRARTSMVRAQSWLNSITVPLRRVKPARPCSFDPQPLTASFF